ncbi:MAG: GDP-mannose 4,6-dehydratase [Actinomycetales bacterium]|nr:GDP-mannose 4,6-dehydratase [Actinomycetales bacterium]
MTMDLAGRRVLVTGGEGFLGSTLIDALLEQGATVRALVHYKPYGDHGHLRGRHQEVELIAGDIRDPQRVSVAVRGQEVVFHLAGLVAAPYSLEAPDSYVQTNIAGTHNVLAAVREHGVARMVHTSSGDTYGAPRYLPVDEGHPLQPTSPYSATKIAADMLALSYWHAFNTPVAVCRPFNTYGPRQSMRAVIPTILHQALSGAPTIALGDLAAMRDFTYVSDTIAGFLAVARSDAALGSVVNIGSGVATSIGDLARICVAVTGSPAHVIQDPQRMRPSGAHTRELVCDNTRARQWCNWHPTVDLREGLRRTADWVAANRALDATRYET